VEFDIRDADGAGARPTRHFSMSIEESRKGSFQASERVPAVTGSTGSPSYIDVGVNIECTVQESAGKAALRGELEITSITGTVILGAISQPIIGQRKMTFNSTLALGTPVVIGPAGPKYHIEATVTKVN